MLSWGSGLPVGDPLVSGVCLRPPKAPEPAKNLYSHGLQ